jgi:putative long chain acyl-CoA synthase
VALLPGTELEAADLDGALAGLPEGQRPSVVRRVDEIPVTTWFRPRTELLRREGLAKGEAGWELDAVSGAYRPRRR